MDFAEPIVILGAGELPNLVTDRAMTVAPCGHSSIDVYSSAYTTLPGAVVARISGAVVTCLTVSKIRITTVPAR